TRTRASYCAMTGRTRNRSEPGPASRSSSSPRFAQPSSHPSGSSSASGSAGSGSFRTTWSTGSSARGDWNGPRPAGWQFQRARSLGRQSRRRRESVEQNARRELGPLLRQVAENDSRSQPTPPFAERDATEHGVEQRRLAASVRAEHGDALRPAQLELERTEPKGAAFDDCALEAHHHIAAALGRSELQA